MKVGRLPSASMAVCHCVTVWIASFSLWSLSGWKYIRGQYTATLVTPVHDLHCSFSM